MYYFFYKLFHKFFAWSICPGNGIKGASPGGQNGLDGPARARATLCPAWPRPEGHLGPLAPALALLASLVLTVK